MNAPGSPSDNEPAKPSQADPRGVIHNTIIANILKKVKAGGIPTRHEQDQLDSYFTGQAATSPAPVGPTAAVPQSRSEFAKFYDVDVKTISRWKADGKKKGAPPPLADPAAMVEWWPKVYTNAVSDKIAAAVVRQKAGAAPEGAAAAPAQPQFDFGAAGDFSIDDALESARSVFQAYALLLEDARKRGDVAGIRAHLSGYEKAAETYNAMQRNRAKVLSSEGLVLSKAEVRAELMRLHAGIPRRLRTLLPEKILPQIPLELRSRIAPLIQAAVDEAFQALRDANFFHDTE